jgi:Tfp pilus assembly protein PilN
MNEIDLLPQWYKSNKKKQTTAYAQYAALGLVLFIMIVWILFTNSSVKKVQAELVNLETKRNSTETTIREFSELTGTIEQLKQNINVDEKIDSHIDVSGTLAELSYICDNSIVLSRLSFWAEKFDKTRGKFQINSAALSSRPESLSGPVRFAVRMTGVAVDSEKVADLICRLEDSPYFCQVTLLYSENKKPKNKNIFFGGEAQITEFEIGCFIANYEEK